MEINNPQAHAELVKQVRRYQEALIDNNVAILNELFWDNPLTVRYGIGENLYGYAAITAYRRTRESQSLGHVVETAVVTTYGRDAGTSNVEFKRMGRTVRRSQTWVRMAEGWRIVAAHVSVLREAG